MWFPSNLIWSLNVNFMFIGDLYFSKIALTAAACYLGSTLTQRVKRFNFTTYMYINFYRKIRKKKLSNQSTNQSKCIFRPSALFNEEWSHSLAHNRTIGQAITVMSHYEAFYWKTNLNCLISQIKNEHQVQDGFIFLLNNIKRLSLLSIVQFLTTLMKSSCKYV